MKHYKSRQFNTKLMIYNYISNPKTLLLAFLLFFFFAKSQNIKQFQIPDSLKNKTYNELYTRINLNINHRDKALIYAKAYLNKAKNAIDTVKIATGYTQMAPLFNPKISELYSDSIITITQNLKNDTYPGYGYLLKGLNLYNLGHHTKALNYLLLANNFANKHHNLEIKYFSQNCISALKNLWGFYNESINIYKLQLKLLEQHNFKNKDILYFETLYNLSNSYILNKKYDSAEIITNLGLKKSLKTVYKRSYFNFQLQLGFIAYYKNKYDKALSYLNKSESFLNNYTDYFNIYYFKGNIYKKLHQNKKAFIYLKKADSIYNITQDAVPEVIEIQEYFVDYYKKNNDVQNQLKYINRLLKIDSIIDINRKNINQIIVQKYDKPNLISEKETIINTLKAKNQDSTLTISTLTILSLLILFLMVRVYKKQLFLKKQNTHLKRNIVQIKSEIKPTQKQITTIPSPIKNTILDALNEFENNHGFLNHKITLNSLSKSLKTNSNYLSKVINTSKEKNFSTYISDLRIDYCIQQLQNNETWLKYTITAISFELGFNNVESFSRAFYKKTNSYPSNYIKELQTKFNSEKKA